MVLYDSREGVDEGTCYGLTDEAWTGCGIFLEGPADCKGSGDDLWWGAQQIRYDGECGRCGYKSFRGAEGGECKLKIDYVSYCGKVTGQSV